MNLRTGNEEIIFVTTDKFCVPGKPLITNPDESVPVDTEVTITWLAPKYDGGDSAITYKLELRMTPITKDTEVRIEENITETQFMIKGLENGKTYQVTLVACQRIRK
ncbi:hypothetical protein OS493_039722 [Desmophyllum pertusum]|uniref:Fibronectin type-III domain-containing protein n=1 Tax=Desmophyllum pertusum TaxID=174260 RepID=A0A9W9Y6M6_9CNID|nr:hypothetical protein OS493_039722 [Desmophyllum pertusum]